MFSMLFVVTIHAKQFKIVIVEQNTWICDVVSGHISFVVNNISRLNDSFGLAPFTQAANTFLVFAPAVLPHLRAIECLLCFRSIMSHAHSFSPIGNAPTIMMSAPIKRVIELVV